MLCGIYTFVCKSFLKSDIKIHYLRRLDRIKSTGKKIRCDLHHCLVIPFTSDLTQLPVMRFKVTSSYYSSRK